MIFLENSELESRIANGTAHKLRESNGFAAFWVDKCVIDCRRTEQGRWAILSIVDTDIPDPTLPEPDAAAKAAMSLVDRIHSSGSFDLKHLESEIAQLLRTWGK